VSKPTHNPESTTTNLPALYPTGSPVWMWSAFYEEWLAGYVSSVSSTIVFVRTPKDYRWVNDAAHLVPRNREEDPCDEASLRREDWLGMSKEVVLKHVDFVEPRNITTLTIRTDLSRHQVTRSLHRLRDAGKVNYDRHVYGWRTPLLVKGWP
jgi:hypothetical protein